MRKPNNKTPNHFQEQNVTNGTSSIRSEEEFIDKFEDISLKMNFKRMHLHNFWLPVHGICPAHSTENVKMLFLFFSSYNCEVGFTAMVAIKTKLGNCRLQLSNTLRLKLTDLYNCRIDSFEIGEYRSGYFGVNEIQKDSHCTHNT